MSDHAEAGKWIYDWMQKKAGKGSKDDIDIYRGSGGVRRNFCPSFIGYFGY
jgi:hypothetical protein